MNPTKENWGWKPLREAARSAYIDWHGQVFDPSELKGTQTILTPPNANPKLAKSSIPIYGITLAPAGSSGYQVCPNRSKLCEEACLGVVAGRGRMPRTRAARILKTKLLFENPYRFFLKLNQELYKAVRKHGSWRLALRCNVLSDLPWEDFAPELHTYPIIRYDYTKVFSRLVGWKDIHYTFSYSGHNARLCFAALKRGVNVAVVVSNEVKEKCLAKGRVDIFGGNYPVLDGDISDARFLDPQGHIVLLRGKGKIPTSLFHTIRMEELPINL